MPIYLLSPRTILVVEVTIKLKNMMDDKKIEEVAKVYMIGEFYDRDEAEWNYPITNEEKRNQCIIDFKAGAKWAINEFLKDLLHPAKDIPEEERPVLVVYKHGGYSIVYWEAYNISGQVNYWTLDITQWLYVDELFSKEGGEHD